MTTKALQSPSLLRARDTLSQLASDEAATCRWETGLEFDELNRTIRKSFLGIPGRVDGEPICTWMISECQRDAKVRDETMRFVVSAPLYEAVTRRKYFDVSVRTNDGTLASTAVLVDYNLNEFALCRWWDKVVGNWQEAVLALRVWRRGALPVFLASNEWNRKALLTTNALSQMHLKNGPRHRHCYVNFVATNPDLQGQGYGSRIMRKICELADEERADCFLDCGNEKNKSFYERFGFVVVASRVLDDEAASADAAERMTAYGMVRTVKEY